jgi:hypothetical protein
MLLVRPMLVVSMLSYSGLHSALRKARLMTLLIHLGVLSVGRLRITAIVTIGTVVCVAIWGSILSHALREAWALRAILRRGIIARGCRLVPDGRELRVWRSLSGHTDGLSHLTIDGSFAWGATLVPTLLDVGTVALIVSLAQSLFLLLLGFPLFPDFLEFCEVDKSARYCTSINDMPRLKGQGEGASFRR